MLDLPTIADLQAAAESVTNPELKKLLADRLADTVRCELQNLTHVLVVEIGDPEEDIVDAIGFSPLVSRIDRIRNQPDWDWLKLHEGWWELLYTVGNDGFAYIIFVQDDGEEPSEIADLCRGHAGWAG